MKVVKIARMQELEVSMIKNIRFLEILYVGCFRYKLHEAEAYLYLHKTRLLLDHMKEL